MPRYFTQDCPTCGRHLRIKQRDENQRLACPHCEGTLIAHHPQPAADADWRSALVKRADELLALVAMQSSLVGAT